MESSRLQDSIRIPPATNNDDFKSFPMDSVLIYFIPGNPGLIEYYRDFLHDLHAHLTENGSEIEYEVLGDSLAGFEINEPLSYLNKPPPHNLREQIGIVEQRLSIHIAERYAGAEPVKVILIGHSVGAYILMELLARRQEAQRQEARYKMQSPNAQSEIVGGIHLFPTIVDLADSPRGSIAAPIAKLSLLAPLMHNVARLLTFLLSANLLLSLVRWITGMPNKAAQTTAAFLRSPKGVLQALYMARYELLEMTEDKWPADLWDASVAATSDLVKIDRPRLYFYWGGSDYWIDNRTRDSIIARRGGRAGEAADAGKPVMEVDGGGVPHDFCIRHSKPIAEKVAEYITEITTSRTPR